MKLIKYTLCVVAVLLVGINTFAQKADTLLYWKMTNPRIVRISGTDNWLEFDGQIKCSVTGVYASSIDFRITVNNSAFPVSQGTSGCVNTLANQYAELNTNGVAKYTPATATLTGTGTGASPYRLAAGFVPNASSGQQGGPAYYSEVSTTWHTALVIRIKYKANDVSVYALDALMQWIKSGVAVVKFAYKPSGKYLARALPTASFIFDNKDFNGLYLGRVYCESKGWTSVGVNGTTVKNSWKYNYNTSVWNGIGHVDSLYALAGKLRIYGGGNYSSTDSAQCYINPAKGLTCNGATEIRVFHGLFVASDATGTGAFIDNGTMTYALHIQDPYAVTVQRYLTDPVVGYYWHDVSAPMQGMTLQWFNGINGLSYSYEWTESQNKWTNIWQPATSVPAMKGLTLAFLQHTGDVTLWFAGKTFTGAQSITLTKSNNSGIPANDNWNFCGNPYPSPINWETDAGWTRLSVGPTN